MALSRIISEIQRVIGFSVSLLLNPSDELCVGFSISLCGAACQRLLKNRA